MLWPEILTVFLILSTSLPHRALVVYMHPPQHLAETLNMSQRVWTWSYSL